MHRRTFFSLGLAASMPLRATIPPPAATEKLEERESANYEVEIEKMVRGWAQTIRGLQTRSRHGDEFTILQGDTVTQTVTQSKDGRITVYATPGYAFKHRWSFEQKVFELPDGGTAAGSIEQLDPRGKRIGEPQDVFVEVEKSDIFARFIFGIEYGIIRNSISFVYRGRSRLPYLVQMETLNTWSDTLLERQIFQRME